MKALTMVMFSCVLLCASNAVHAERSFTIPLVRSECVLDLGELDPSVASDVLAIFNDPLNPLDPRGHFVLKEETDPFDSGREVEVLEYHVGGVTTHRSYVNCLWSPPTRDESVSECSRLEAIAEGFSEEIDLSDVDLTTPSVYMEAFLFPFDQDRMIFKVTAPATNNFIAYVFTDDETVTWDGPELEQQECFLTVTQMFTIDHNTPMSNNITDIENSYCSPSTAITWNSVGGTTTYIVVERVETDFDGFFVLLLDWV